MHFAIIAETKQTNANLHYALAKNFCFLVHSPKTQPDKRFGISYLETSYRCWANVFVFYFDKLRWPIDDDYNVPPFPWMAKRLHWQVPIKQTRSSFQWGIAIFFSSLMSHPLMISCIMIHFKSFHKFMN